MFNVGTGTEVTIDILIKEIESVTDVKAVIDYKPWPSGDTSRIWRY